MTRGLYERAWRRESLLGVILLTTLAANCSPARAGQTSVASSSPAASSSVTTSSSSSAADKSTGATYQDMRELWENCERIKSTSIDILAEGRNAPARKKWLDYYLSLLQNDLNTLKTASSTLSVSQFAGLDAPWKSSQDDIAKLGELVDALAKDLQTVKSPTDDTYPAHYWKPASELKQGAEKLDASLLAIFSSLNTAIDQSNPDGKSTIANAAAQAADGALPKEPLKGYATAVRAETGVKQLEDAAKQVSKSCWGLFGELERWNLLYGNPPAGGIPDGFYGGGLTKQEIMTEFKYLPQFTFTNPPYVMLYSYRLPPRQNMLAYHTTNIGKVLNMMEADLNDMKIPADRQLATAGPLDDAKRTFLDCRKNYLSLYNAVNNTDDKRLQKNIREDQLLMGQPVSSIYSDMAKLRDALADLGKLLK